MNTDLNFKSVLDEFISFYKKNWKEAFLPSIVATLWILPIFIPLLGLLLIPIYTPLGSLLLGGPLFIGLCYVTDKLLKKEKHNINDTFAGFRSWINSVGGVFIIATVVSVGIVFFVFPGYYLLGRLFPAFFILQKKDAKIIESLRQAWDMTENKHIELGLSLLAWNILIVVSLCILYFPVFFIIAFIPFIGPFLLIPIWILLISALYQSALATVITIYNSAIQSGTATSEAATEAAPESAEPTPEA